MGLNLQGLASGGADLFDSGMANLTGLANTINRGIIARGFQDAVMPTINRETDRMFDQSKWFDQFGHDTYNARRDAFAANQANYGAASAGQGARATAMREGYLGQGGALQQADDAIGYADSVVNPLLGKANETYDTAKQQFLDTKAKMATASNEAVSQAKMGLDRVISSGEGVLKTIVDGVATGIADLTTRMASTEQDVEQRAQMLENSGQKAQAEALRQRGKFAMSAQVGDQVGKLRVQQSALEVDARQKNIALTTEANNAVISAIATTSANEAGANAASVRNLIDAVGAGNQAAALAINGPLAARMQKAMMGERFATNMSAAVGMDQAEVDAHAINVDNMIASNAQQYANTVLTGVNTALNGMAYVLQGNGAVAQMLAGFTFNFTPGASQAVNDYLQITAAQKQPDSGGNFFDTASDLAFTGASVASLF